MVKFLIDRPVAVLMISMAFIVLGVVSAIQIPTSLMPDIAVPEISVQLAYPNSTARELETNVVRPLRNSLLQLSNLKDIRSETRDGFATLKLQFDYGTDTDYAFVEANEKVDASLNVLPRDLDRPRVVKASLTDVPIVNLSVSLKDGFTKLDFLELSLFAETVLKKRLEQLPDIAFADINGQVKNEVRIRPKLDKLRSLGITNNTLIEAIKQNNFDQGNLVIQNGIYQYNFSFTNPLRDVDDIRSLYLNLEGKLFQMQELADIEMGTQREKGNVFVDGQRSINFAIIKQAETQVYKVQEELDLLLQTLRADYPELQFKTNQDQSRLLKLSIDNLKSSLLLGGLFAILILFFFLKDLKSPLIIAIAIPLSLVLSLLLMYVLGLSVNIISLSGLILGIGMMIDNAIIVADNIAQKLENDHSISEACVKGTNEIISPLISSVLTTCSVFLPLIFLSGITGALFYDQAIAVSLGLGSSLVVSILIIPVLYKQLYHREFGFDRWLKGRLQNNGLENMYVKGYAYFSKSPWVVYLVSLVGIVCALLFFQLISYEQLPDLEQGEAQLTIDWNEPVNLQESQVRIASLISGVDDIQTQFAEIGETQYLLQSELVKSPSEARIYLNAGTNAKIKRSQRQLAEKLSQQYPKANFGFSKPKTAFEYIFGSDNRELIAKVYPKSSLEVPQVKELPDIAVLFGNTTSSEIPTKVTVAIEILHENLLLYKVDYADLLSELKTTLGENFIDDLKTAESFIPINLVYQADNFESIFSDLFVMNEEGKQIAVSNLIEVRNDNQYRSIIGSRIGEYLEFEMNSPNDVERQMDLIRERFKPSPYDIKFDGNWFYKQELAGELAVVITVSLLLLYLIMAAQFESFWQPLIIILEVPIDIGGALLLLWLFGGTINLMSMIGIVVMSGIIINDSILKIHTINLLRKEGKPLEEAVKEGSKLRLKPIVMTSLTTILALVPFLFIDGLGSLLQRPLALTVIGGMLIGTFISLYLIPLLYMQFAKLKR